MLLSIGRPGFRKKTASSSGPAASSFALHSEGSDEFDFSGEQKPGEFPDAIEEARERDEHRDGLEILTGIEHPDIDGAIRWEL